MIDDQTLDRIIEFHGHMCPGVAMGIQAATIALRDIGPHSTDEEIVAVVETDSCGVDAIQFLTGCTFGKGNLIHRDWGKNVYTFYRRSDGKAIRVVGRPEAWAKIRDPEHQAVFTKVRSGKASDDEATHFWAAHEDKSRTVLEMSPDELYTVAEVQGEPPHKARVYTSVPCGDCGEEAMEIRIRRFAGRELCPPCFEAALGET
ncbi:MAG TPA: FmdE family protein [Acidimicrobiales bacterium]|nr:FmdE family protein [Acidimicrobiales bacterium]